MDKIKNYIYAILVTFIFVWPIIFIGDSLKEPYGISAIGCMIIWVGFLVVILILWFFLSAWIGGRRSKNNPTYSFEYDENQSLYNNMKRMVEEELNSQNEFKNEWLPKAKEISRVANTTKENVVDWINSNPKNLFEFAYSQYQDPSAPLYNISIPLIKASGILGYTDALVFVASHCVNRLDINEATYGLALLNTLSKKNVAGAKHILAYLYYNGHRILDIKINGGKAGEMLYDIQKEECFLKDGDALTMFALLIDSEIIEVEDGKPFLNILGKDGYVKKTKELPLDKRNPIFWDEEGNPNSAMIMGMAALLGNPFAKTVIEAISNKDKSLMQKIAKAFEQGYFFKDTPKISNEDGISEEEQLNARLYMITGGTGHWKGRFDIGNLVPISPSMVEIWNDMIEEFN